MWERQIVWSRQIFTAYADPRKMIGELGQLKVILADGEGQLLKVKMNY